MVQSRRPPSRPARAGFVRAAVWGALGLNVACTFYTNCPEVEPQPGGTGATPGSGGTTGGGSGGTGTGGSGAPVTPVEGEWTDATGSLVGERAGYANVTYVTYDPGRSRLLAVLSEVGMWASNDGGNEWVKLGSDDRSDAIANRGTNIVFDPSDIDVFWEAGHYGPGVFKTTDGGDRFTNLGGIEHNEGLAIDFSDPDRDTMFTGIHERGHPLNRTRNGGEDWEELPGPSEANACSWPFLAAPDTVLFACSQWGDKIGGVFRSTDAGESWERATELAPASQALRASDGTIYWPAEANSGLLASDDDGVTWTRVTESLNSLTPTELPDGRLAGMRGKFVVVSDDGGVSWEGVSPELPFAPAGFTYATALRAFYAWNSTADETIPAEAIMTFAFDYEAVEEAEAE
jgi:photosystem II stability/assembly factor-like uncharacterized protein